MDAPYPTATISTSYTDTYGESEPYGRQEASSHGRIIEEAAEDQYHLSGSVDTAQLPGIRRGVPEAESDTFNLQPTFSSGRRRSFTLPNDFSTSQP